MNRSPFKTAWSSDVQRYILSVSDVHKTCVCVWEQSRLYKKSEENGLGFSVFNSINGIQRKSAAVGIENLLE